MSNVEVEQRHSMHSVYHFDGSNERAAFSSGHSAPRTISAMSRTPVPVINVDDDSDTPEESGPSTSRQRADSGARDHPVYIIDDDDGAPSISISTNNGGQASPIVVLDSDDDEQTSRTTVPQQPRLRHSTLRRRGGRNSSSSFRIFSPPPPPQHYEVPPVPPIPPIIARPLPFSLLVPPNQSAQSHLPFDEPHQTPTSTLRTPNIQLGGGLFSQGSSSGRRRGPRTQLHFQPVHDDFFEEIVPRATNPNTNHNPSSSSSNFRGVPTSAMETFTRFGRFVASYMTPSSAVPASNTGQTQTQTFTHVHNQRPRGRARMNPLDTHSLREFYEGSLSDFFLQDGPRGVDGYYEFTIPGLGPWARRDAAVGLGPEYNKAMTHPGRPGIGWTFDFGVEEGEEEEKGKATAETAEILVCAKCLDPLLANAEGMVDVSESERKDRRVWGLRCGHVLDGKCISGLMKPTEEEEEKEKEKEGVGATAKGKCKGKGKQVDKEVTRVDDIKGKGKAPASVPDEPPSENSMRSRLRTRRNTVVPWSASTSPSTRQRRQANTQPIPAPNTTRRRGTKRKKDEEIIEARREWTCPVSGCERVHGSIKVGGVWKMDPERGAVGIYV